ncbi:MAG: cytochrome c [Crocinitomicaceae bacterium]|nr:cytochrome c [Crocinitomicaceae bacterium]
MVLRRITYLFSISLLLLSCELNTTDSATPKDEQSVVVPDGIALFNTHCATCHGLDGSLGVGGAKDLSKSTLDLLTVRKTIESGTIGGMPRFKETFTIPELESVTQYVLTLKRH